MGTDEGPEGSGAGRRLPAVAGDGGLMRCLHLLEELRPSGAEVMLRDGAPMWRAAGVENLLLTVGREPGPLTDELRAAGYRILHLPFRPRPGHLAALRRLLVREAPDLVHVHPERAFFWHALVARSVGAPVVRTVHNVFRFRGPLRWERIVQRAVLRRLGVAFVSVSGSVARCERDHLHNPTVTVPNGVDTDRYAPPTPGQRQRARERLGLAGDELVIVSVGNCGPAKNHGALLRGLARLTDPGASWRYLHAGIEEPGRPERALARRLGVTGRCRFLGFEEDVPGLLHAADVYVMPSLHEGLPVAALEAAATGLRCVLADSPGLSDVRGVVPEGITWTAPEAAPLARALRAAAREITAGCGPGRRASRMHEAVAEHYGLERSVRRYATLYCTALQC